MPEFAARNAFDAGALYAARGGGPEQLRKNLARVLGVAAGRGAGRLIRASLASYARYWREAFRLPSMDHASAGPTARADAVRASEHVGGGAGRRPRRGPGAAAQRQLGHGRRVAGQHLRHVRHRRRAAQARVAVQRFLDYRESLGFEVLPLTGGERPPFEVLAERLRGQRAGVPDGRPRPDPLRRPGRLLRRATRLPAGPAKLALETGAALLPVHSWYEPDDCGDSTSTRRWTRRRATSASSPRRWPTGSPPTSPRIPPTGTCCSRSGWPTCPTKRRARLRRRLGGPDADRHGLPVLVRRARRRAGARAAAGRGDARLRPRGQRAGAVVAARDAARLRRLRRQGRADPVQRVGRAAAVRPGHPPQGQEVARRRASSTCCTCTSPTRRACRCWR